MELEGVDTQYHFRKSIKRAKQAKYQSKNSIQETIWPKLMVI